MGSGSKTSSQVENRGVVATGSSDWLAFKVFALTRRGLLDPDANAPGSRLIIMANCAKSTI